MPSPPPASCSSTSAPFAWPCVSKWQRSSWSAFARSRPLSIEVLGFKYFDDRDLIGFVDGTENPENDAAGEAALIGAEDPDFGAEAM